MSAVDYRFHPPFARAERVGEGGAKRRMRAGALKRDGGATGTMRHGADGKTAQLRFAALIRPSGTFAQSAIGRRGKRP
jgi:hypothetical protein